MFRSTHPETPLSHPDPYPFLIYSSNALQRLAGFFSPVRRQHPRPLANPRGASIEVQKSSGRIPLRVEEMFATLAQLFGPFVKLDRPHVDVVEIRGQDPRHEGRPRRRVWIDDVVHLGAASLASIVDDALGRCRCARGDEDFDEDLG